MADFEIEFNGNVIREIEQLQYKAAIRTANSILLDVSAEETVPFDNGIMEASGQTNPTQDGAQISYGTNYVEKQYFDESLNHNQGPHAGTAKAHWLDDYVDGDKKDWVQEKFGQHYQTEFRRMFGI